MVTSRGGDRWAAATFLPYTRLCLNPKAAPVPSQVLERRSWQGLDEVLRLLNCSELAFTGGRRGGRGWAGPVGGARGWSRPWGSCAREELSPGRSLRRRGQGRQGLQRVPAPHPGGVPGWLHFL